MDYQSLIDFDLKNDNKGKTEPKKVNPKKESQKKQAPKPEVSRKRPQPPQEVEVETIEEINYDIPSRQYGDLFCVVCDSHMNSEQMWENHIKGKRHLKNSRKGDVVEQKYEYSSEEPLVQKELDKESRPLAGLDHICEIIRANQTPVYQCFLCSASILTPKLLLEHLMGLKHQLAFLKEHDKEKYSLVDSSALSKSYLEPIVQDLIQKYEQEHGRGKMSVKKEKKSASSYSYKKSSDNDKHPASKSAKHQASEKSRYSPPPKSSRYSPPPSSSSRYSPPPSSSRYSPPPKTSRYSSQKSGRMKEIPLESEWQKVPPVRERSRESDRERSYSERSYYEEEWSNNGSESTCYRRESSRPDALDSKYERADSYGRTWQSVNEENDSNDLRIILEQKKSLGRTSRITKAKMDVPASSPTKYNTVPDDKLISLINDLSPEMFLKLAIFKLDSIVINEEIELTLLDRVAEKAFALSDNIKMKLRGPDLKAKYQESLLQSGIPPEDKSIIPQNLENLIAHYKARKTTAYEDAVSQGTYSSQIKSSENFIDSKTVSQHQLNTSSSYQNTQERPSSYDSGWSQRPSSSLPFQSFSSTPACIPGLTLTEESPKPSTVVSQFAQTAKNIFGNITVPTPPANPYQSEDYNRLNYRY